MSHKRRGFAAINVKGKKQVGCLLSRRALRTKCFTCHLQAVCCCLVGISNLLVCLFCVQDQDGKDTERIEALEARLVSRTVL